MFGTDFSLADPRLRRPSFRRPAAEDAFSAAATPTALSIPWILKKYVAELDAAAQAALDPSRFVWVVVGDASVVKPQLDALGLPVEVRSASGAAQ